MNETVKVPIRVVIDPASAATDLPDIAQRTRSAATRALSNSAQTTGLADGNAALWARPQVTFTGEAADALDGDARARITNALDTAIADASDAALGTRTEEPGDRETADGDSEEPTEEDDEVQRALIARRFRRMTIAQAFAEADALTRDPDFAEFTLVPQWGVVFEGERGFPHIIVFQAVADGFQQLATFELTRLFEAGLDESGATPQLVLRVVKLSALESITVTYFASGPRDEVEPLLVDYYAALYTELRTDILGGSAANFQRHEITAQVSEEIEATVADELGEGGEDRHFILLQSGGRRFLIQVNFPVPESLGAHVYPLTEVDLSRMPGGSTSGREGGTGAGGRRGRRGRRRQGSGDGEGRRRGRGGDGGDGGSGAGGDGPPGGTAEGRGGDGAPGFVVGPEDLMAQKGGQSFPLAGPGATPIALTCRDFEGEASLTDLGDSAAGLQAQMRQIAYLLQIPTCEYPAQFCINSMKSIEARAWGVSAASRPENDRGFTAPVSAGSTGNLGILEFQPVPSPAIQLLRQFARTVPMISALAGDLRSLYMSGGYDSRLPGHLRNNGTAWALRLGIELTDAARDALGIHFMVACQVLLLQLLRHSRTQIDRRLDNFDVYGPLFLSVVRTQLSDVAVYENLRERLEHLPPSQALARGEAPAEPDAPGDWSGAAQSMLDAIDPDTRSHEARANHEGEVVLVADERMIFDAEGNLWSMEMLERAILLRRGNAEDTDPLIKQLIEIPEIVARLQGDPEAVLNEIRAMLREMQNNNAEMQRKAAADARFAFEASPIHESLEGASVPGTQFALQGVHRLAHDRMGSFFGGSEYYSVALNRLFGAELGFQALTEFFQTLSVITLSIICPPVGAAVDRLFAAIELANAEESERLFESLIDPELVISRGQVEAQLFAARLSAALAFVPGVGRLIGTGRQALRVGRRAGVRMAVASAGRRIARQVTRETVEALARTLPEIFVEEILVDQAMDLVVGKILEGVIADIQREARITGSVGGTAGAAESIEIYDLAPETATLTPNRNDGGTTE